jgi:hypothetical protein
MDRVSPWAPRRRGHRPELIVAALVATSCRAAPAAAPTTPARADPQQAFWASLRALCGRAFDGVVTANAGGDPATDPFAGQVLRMHVRTCSESEIRIPFHVGEDRSRTWVFTRTPGGLRLEHDHRHADGTSDAVTMYGGSTVHPGTSNEQAFPAGEASRSLFLRRGLAASVDNIWIVNIVPGKRFSYALTRPGREVRVEFELTAPVEAPPPPWGSE